MAHKNSNMPKLAWHNTSFFSIILLKFFLFASLPLDSFANNEDSKSVLIINSYHQGLSWTDSLNSGIKEKLKGSGIQVEIYDEYLDSKRVDMSKSSIAFYNLLKLKYESLDLDLIFVTDNNALNFVEHYKDSLFKDVPVVFCGINNRYEFPKGFTGVVEEVDIKSNVELIKKLHPSLTKLYVVIDRTTTGEALRSNVEELIQRNLYPFPIQILSDYSALELRELASGFKTGDVLLFLLFNVDKNQEYHDFDQALISVSEVCSVPIYGTWDFYLNHGIVGGNLISGRVHGQKAGELGVRILSGAIVVRINQVVGSTSFAFDQF